MHGLFSYSYYINIKKTQQTGQADPRGQVFRKKHPTTHRTGPCATGTIAAVQMLYYGYKKKKGCTYTMKLLGGSSITF